MKECSESEYWIELLIESEYYADKTILDNKEDIYFINKYGKEKQ